MMSTETTAHEAAAEATGVFDPGESIMHHILDSPEIEIPLTDMTIELPQFEPIGGVLDLSITKHVAMMWAVSVLLALVLALVARRKTGVVPSGLRNVFEVFVVFIRDEVALRAMPNDGNRFLGYLLTTFFFILACNLWGLIPGMATATGNISVTAGLAVISFVVIQVSGVRRYGVIKHVGNLLPHGLPAPLVPLMFVLEILSSLIRPFALCIRLFANMMAGHVVILAFISLIFILASMFSPVVGFAAAPVAVFFALFVHFLELLVAFLQAFIFTMLTAQFIGMSVQPSH